MCDEEQDFPVATMDELRGTRVRLKREVIRLERALAEAHSPEVLRTLPAVAELKFERDTFEKRAQDRTAYAEGLVRLYEVVGKVTKDRETLGSHVLIPMPLWHELSAAYDDAPEPTVEDVLIERDNDMADAATAAIRGNVGGGFERPVLVCRERDGECPTPAKCRAEGCDAFMVARADPPEASNGEGALVRLGNKINRAAYEGLIADDLEWLDVQSPSLARDHIRDVLVNAADRLFGNRCNEGVARVEGSKP